MSPMMRVTAAASAVVVSATLVLSPIATGPANAVVRSQVNGASAVLTAAASPPLILQVDSSTQVNSIGQEWLCRYVDRRFCAG